MGESGNRFASRGVKTPIWKGEISFAFIFDKIGLISVFPEIRLFL